MNMFSPKKKPKNNMEKYYSRVDTTTVNDTHASKGNGS